MAASTETKDSNKSSNTEGEPIYLSVYLFKEKSFSNGHVLEFQPFLPNLQAYNK